MNLVVKDLLEVKNVGSALLGVYGIIKSCFLEAQTISEQFPAVDWAVA